jgi:hypothetical protein
VGKNDIIDKLRKNTVSDILGKFTIFTFFLSFFIWTGGLKYSVWVGLIALIIKKFKYKEKTLILGFIRTLEIIEENKILFIKEFRFSDLKKNRSLYN